MLRYLARSASDRDPLWPVWFIADQKQGGLNVTGSLCGLSKGAVLVERLPAILFAAFHNAQEKEEA